MKDLVVACLAALLFFVVLAWAMDTFGDVLDTADKIAELDGSIPPQRRERLALVFAEASSETGVPSSLLVAVAWRESHFRISVEEGRVRGRLGEVGLMQIHGAALQFRPQNCGRDLPSARCQIFTGARYLAHLRDACPGPWQRWIAAYGSGECPRGAPWPRDVRVLEAILSRLGGAE